MKKSFSLMAMASAALMLFAVSCKNDNPEGPGKDVKLVAPVLGVSTHALTIEEYTDDLAITFAWDDVAKAAGFKDANNDGTYDKEDNCSIAYSLQITKAGDTEFTAGTSYKVPATTANIGKSFSFNELKDLASEIGADIKAGFELIARVRVTADGCDAVLSNVVNATIGEKALAIDHLYLIGEATNWGWNQDAAEEMTNNGGVFTWTGHLYGNAEFKFLCQVGGVWWPGVVRDASAAEYWTPKVGYGDADDVKFKVEKPGTYTITLDAKNSNAMSIKVEFVKEDDKIVINELYVLGSACNAGWSLDDMEAFTNDGGIFTWTGALRAYQEFRFPLQKQSNVWWPCIMISADGQSIAYGVSDNDKQVYQLEEDGVYKIVIDARDFDNMSYTIEMVEKGLGFATIYPIGGMNWGWDKDNAEAMTTDDGVHYTWTGFIWAGADFKFLVGNSDWVPSFNRDESAGEYWTLVKRMTYDDPDVQFQVAESGNYKISLNINDLTIKVEPVSGFPDIYPIGCINDWGWSLDKTEPMHTDDGITYTADVKVWADNNFKFLCQNNDWWPGYTRDENADDYFTVVFNDGSLPDTQFRLDTQGMESANYHITLNVQTCKLTLELIPE